MPTQQVLSLPGARPSAERRCVQIFLQASGICGRRGLGSQPGACHWPLCGWLSEWAHACLSSRPNRFFLEPPVRACQAIWRGPLVPIHRLAVRAGAGARAAQAGLRRLSHGSIGFPFPLSCLPFWLAWSQPQAARDAGQPLAAWLAVLVYPLIFAGVDGFHWPAANPRLANHHAKRKGPQSRGRPASGQPTRFALPV